MRRKQNIQFQNAETKQFAKIPFHNTKNKKSCQHFCNIFVKLLFKKLQKNHDVLKNTVVS